MNERLSKGKNYYRAGLAGIAAASLALTGCGGDGDKGSYKIGACPKGFTAGQTALTTPGEAMQEMSAGVAKLTAGIEATPWFGQAGTNENTNFGNLNGQIDITDMPAKYIAAANAVFRVHRSFLGLDNDSYRIEHETRVDDVSEVVCSDANKLYLTPNAESVMGTLRAGGFIPAAADMPATTK